MGSHLSRWNTCLPFLVFPPAPCGCRKVTWAVSWLCLLSEAEERSSLCSVCESCWSALGRCWGGGDHSDVISAQVGVCCAPPHSPCSCTQVSSCSFTMSGSQWSLCFSLQHRLTDICCPPSLSASVISPQAEPWPWGFQTDSSAFCFFA